VHAAHREARHDAVLHSEHLVDVEVEVCKGGAEAEDRLLESLHAARAAEVRRQVVLEHRLVARIPRSLDEIADRRDVLLGAHRWLAGRSGRSLRLPSHE
jgi:hypothetical protein